jgi:hypothetical protein
MADYLLRSSSATERVRGNTYSLCDRVVIARADAQGSFALMRKFVYECTVAGAANGASDPIYPTVVGNTVNETSGLQWTCRECTTWANAAKYADYIANNRMAAGDRLLVSQAHVEAIAANLTITFPGTVATPCYFLCVDDSADPPTVLATGAAIASTGSAFLSLTASVIGYGISFSSSTGASGSEFRINTGVHTQRWISCDFISPSTAAAQYRINYSGGGWNAGVTAFDGCRFKFGHTGTRLLTCGQVRMNNVSFLSGGSTPTSIFGPVAGAPIDVEVTNSDFSALSAGVHLVAGGSYLGIRIVIRDTKMPASWSGFLMSAAITTAGMIAEAYNVDAGDTNYTAWTEDYSGTLRQDTGIYLSGTNGMKLNGSIVPLSYKMTASSTAKYTTPKNGLWRALVNEITSSQTATLEIIHNESANLTDDEIWLELDYPATSGSTGFTRLTDAKTNILAAGVAQDTSPTADWDDGLTARANSTAYVVGNIVKSSGTPGSAFICTSKSGTGTSAASEPAGFTGATDGDTITDNAGANQVVWQAMRRQKLSIPFTAAEQGVIRARPVLTKAGAIVWSAAKLTVA